MTANVHSIEIARPLLLRHRPKRYAPIVALLRSALGHRVMIAADGAEWQATHDALRPDFQPAHLAQAVVPVIWAVATEAVSDLASRSSAVPGESAWVTVPVEPQMRILMARIMGHIIFGQVLSSADAARVEAWIDGLTRPIETGGRARINRWLGRILRLFDAVEHQPVLIPPHQRRVANTFVAWISDSIDQAGATAAQGTILANLERRFAGLGPARRRCIAAECAMVFVAGIETTAAALTFAIAEIANDPEILDAVLQDARRDGAPAASAACQNPATYPVIHRVVQETLRRHTIVPTIMREAASDCQADSVTFPRGTVLRFLPIQGHLRARVWPQPKRFDPGRFAQPLSTEQKKNYNPFGLGPQSCLGRTLAIYECVIVLAALFRQLDVRPQAITGPIAVQRNAMFTDRPVGVTVDLKAAEWAGASGAPGVPALV